MLVNIKNYSLTDVVEEGSESSIYRGTKIDDGASVWIKILKNRYPSVSELARLRHAYEISRIFESAQVLKPTALEQFTNSQILIYPNFNGISLETFLKTYTFEIESFLKIAISL